MSGAMVALGVYGLILVGDVLLGGGPTWWWLIVIAMGAMSALFGSLHAASSTDLKRLLAFSTTDNVGLVLLALGTSGLFATSHHVVLASLAMVAALVLVLNHAAFKGALFLSAGSIQDATGTRDLDQLGGLLRRMPHSGALFLAAAASICALPPFNGFIGEWLLFQSLLHGERAGSAAADISVTVSLAVMALTAGLTVVAFVKAAGIGLLGRPRSAAADAAAEVAWTMRLGVGLLVAACVVVGVVPALVMPAVERAVRFALPVGPPVALSRRMDLELVGVRGVIAPLALAGGLVIAGVAVVALRRLLARRPVPRVAEAWGCGRELQTARMQYTATSFAEPVQRVFDDVLRPVTDLDLTHAVESRYYLESASFHNAVDDAVERGLYSPVVRAVRRWGEVARRLQPGSVHRYLGYGFVALIVMLAVAAVLG
jgi:formate hydrogenlyase subunit 3/multisubunit Na+/H+ antiporter MnhD subunit